MEEQKIQLKLNGKIIPAEYHSNGLRLWCETCGAWHVYSIEYIDDAEITLNNLVYRCGCGCRFIDHKLIPENPQAIRIFISSCRFTDHNLIPQFILDESTSANCDKHGEHVLTKTKPRRHDIFKEEVE